jgi:hypothetical protein
LSATRIFMGKGLTQKSPAPEGNTGDGKAWVMERGGASGLRWLSVNDSVDS